MPPQMLGFVVRRRSITRRAGEDIAVRLHARMLRVPDRARCESALRPVELLILREVANRSPARSRAGGVHLQRVRRHICEDFRGLAAVVVTDAWAFAPDDARTRPAKPWPAIRPRRPRLRPTAQPAAVDGGGVYAAKSSAPGRRPNGGGAARATRPAG